MDDCEYIKTVNATKTKYLLFTRRKSNYSAKNTSFKVNFRNNTVEKVSSIRFLGVQLIKT